MIVCLLVAASAAGIAAWAHSRHVGSRGGRCISVVIASTMGGATIKRCGAAAVSFCRSEGPGDAQVAAACRREGFPV